MSDITPISPADKKWIASEMPAFLAAISHSVTTDQISQGSLLQKEILWDASNPLLILPLFTATNWNFTLPDGENQLSVEKLQEVCIHVLDKWQESLKEIEDARRREEPQKEAELVDELHREQRELTAMEHVVKDFRMRVESGDKEALTEMPMVVSTLLIGASFIGAATGGATLAGTIDIGFNVVANVWNVVSPVVVPSDMRAELGLIGALFALNVQYKATLFAIKGGNDPSDAPKDLRFARAYAKEILNLITESAFNRFLLSLATYHTKPNEKTQEKVVALVKIVLLFMALALVYKVETGHLTSEELAGMLNGEILLPADDPRHALIKNILEQLQKIPVNERNRVLDALLEHFGKNPRLDDILEPVRVFDGLSKTEAYRHMGETQI